MFERTKNEPIFHAYKQTPWYADIVNYLVMSNLLFDLSFAQIKNM